MASDYLREKSHLTLLQKQLRIYAFFCYYVNNYQHSSSFTPLIFMKSIEYSTVDESIVL